MSVYVSLAQGVLLTIGRFQALKEGYSRRHDGCNARSAISISVD